MAYPLIQNGEVDDNLAVIYENGQILDVINIDSITDGTIMTHLYVGVLLNLDGEAIGNIAEMSTLVLL